MSHFCHAEPVEACRDIKHLHSPFDGLRVTVVTFYGFINLEMSRKNLFDFGDLFLMILFPQNLYPLNREIAFVFFKHESARPHITTFGNIFSFAKSSNMIAIWKSIILHSLTHRVTPYALSTISRTVSTELVPDIISMRFGRFLSGTNTT